MFKNLLSKAKTSNPILFQLLIVFFILTLLSIVGIGFDPRIVLGINPWYKVLKFDISIFIFAATMIWVLRDLTKEFIRKISKQMAISMYFEIFAITMQAARGTKSHFNNTTILDAIVFTLMGIFIAYNTYLLLRVLIAYFKTPPAGYSDTTILATRLGLIAILFGSVLGGFMSSRAGHSVGAIDGGEGLPFVNWSTVVGDLRVAHFIGLHGLQFFLILGFVLAYFQINSKSSKWILLFSFILFMGFNVFTLIQAMQGHPFLVVK